MGLAFAFLLVACNPIVCQGMLFQPSVATKEASKDVAKQVRFYSAYPRVKRRQGKGWDYHTVTAILKREGLYATKKQGAVSKPH